MRCITITYEYDGDDMVWLGACEAFINAVTHDPLAQGFSYQVAVADDEITRIHWGRWDNDAALKHVQSQDYFKTFVEKLEQLSEGRITRWVADVRDHTDKL